MNRPLASKTVEVEPAAEGTSQTVRRLAITLATGALPGVIAGLVAGGIGSRIAMRVLAVTSDPQVKGFETDFGATVGEITFGGTLFLLVAGIVLGAFGGLIYLGVKRWIPEGGWLGGLGFGVLLLAVFGRLVIDPNNDDFVILEPAGLAVAMFASLFVIYGLMFVPLYERLEPFVRRPRSGRRTALILLPVVIPMLVVPVIGVPLIIVIATVSLTKTDRRWWSNQLVDVLGRFFLLAIAAYLGSRVWLAAADII